MNQKRKLTQRLTRLGFHSLFVGVFAMLGGALRGFNLLLVLAGLMVAALMMQWRLSRRSIEKVKVKRLVPDDIFAGHETTFRYQLENESRWTPAWMVRIEDTVQSQWQSPQGQIATGTPLIEAGGKRLISSNVRFARRGIYQLKGIRIITCFPFSLSTATVQETNEAELIVYPKLMNLRKSWKRAIKHHSTGNTANHHKQGPAEGEFYGLREWRNGDSQKWIHWRTSARLGDLAVRQFEDHKRLDACLIVDAFENNETDPELVESAVSLAASLAVGILGNTTDHADLICVGTSTSVIFGRNGNARLCKKMIESLATLNASDHPQWQAAFEHLNRQRIKPKEVIVISTRTFKQFEADNADISHLLTDWFHRSHLIWTNVKTDLDHWAIVDSEQAVNETKSISPSRTEAAERTKAKSIPIQEMPSPIGSETITQSSTGSSAYVTEKQSVANRSDQ